MRPVLAWSPAFVLAAGAVLTAGVDLQQTLDLRIPLQEAIPMELGGASGSDIRPSEEEIRAAGATEYLMRAYEPGDSAATVPFSVYVGYYDSQTRGKTIHSPKNCLPGAGWEAIAAERVEIVGPDGPIRVNRYVLQNGGRQAMVLYWYQGRGRVESNEYVVKWNLLRDAALRQRSDEALVRIVVPIEGDVDLAFAVAAGAASQLVGFVASALPGA